MEIKNWINNAIDCIDKGLCIAARKSMEGALTELEQAEPNIADKYLRQVHDILQRKYKAAEKNLKNNPDKCDGKDKIEGYMEGVLEGMSYTSCSKSVVMSEFTKRMREYIKINRKRELWEYEPIFKDFIKACDIIDCQTAEIKRLHDDILYLHNEYSSFDGKPCPACEYKDGKFIKYCKLHERNQELKKEIWGYEAEIKRLKECLETMKEYNIPEQIKEIEQALERK